MTVIQPFVSGQAVGEITPTAAARAHEWYQRLMARVAIEDHRIDRAIEAIICARQYQPKVKRIPPPRPAWIVPAPVPAPEHHKATYFMHKAATVFSSKRGRPKKQPAATVAGAIEA